MQRGSCTVKPRLKQAINKYKGLGLARWALDLNNCALVIHFEACSISRTLKCCYEKNNIWQNSAEIGAFGSLWSHNEPTLSHSTCKKQICCILFNVMESLRSFFFSRLERMAHSILIIHSFSFFKNNHIFF